MTVDARAVRWRFLLLLGRSLTQATALSMARLRGVFGK